MTLDAIKSAPLRRQVVERIRDAIFSGRFAPGEPLRETHLAKDLAVSQATVREALVELESAGFVERTQNKGTIVTKLSRKEARERIELRVLLEGVACVAAAARLAPEDIAALRGLSRAIAKAAAREDVELAQADLEFHRYIWRSTGNETLVRTLDQLTAPLFAFVSIMRRRAPRPPLTVNPHDEIIDALVRNVPDEIRGAVRRHIETSSPYREFLESDAGDIRELVSSTLRD